MSSKPPAKIENKHFGYEKRDVNVRLVLIFAGSLLLLLIGTGLLSRFSLHVFSGPSDQHIQTTQAAPPPEPRLEADPVQDLQALHKEEKQRLTSYAWIDRSQGIIQIPIERAMDLTAERGLASRKKS